MNHWEESGWGYKVSSVPELTRLISELGTLRAGQRFVWRGAANAEWAVQSSLQRALEQRPEFFDPDPKLRRGISRIRVAESRILTAAREWGLGFEGGTYLSDLQLLASLQHHGVPTRLLDATTDPMTALWFACQPFQDGTCQPVRGSRDKMAALFAFNVTKMQTLTTIPVPSAGTVESLEDPLGAMLREALATSHRVGNPIVLEPRVRDARMIAQQGCFLFGDEPDDPKKQVPGVKAFVFELRSNPPGHDRLKSLTLDRRAGRPAKIDYCVILIPPTVKKKMRTHLNDAYNKTVRTMYPDMGGFMAAIANQDILLPDPPRKHGRLEKDISAKRDREAHEAMVRSGLTSAPLL